MLPKVLSLSTDRDLARLRERAKVAEVPIEALRLPDGVATGAGSEQLDRIACRPDGMGAG